MDMKPPNFLFFFFFLRWRGLISPRGVIVFTCWTLLKRM